MVRIVRFIPLCALTLGASLAHGQRLRLIQFTTDSTSYHVGATLIAGPTEAVLVDALMRKSDARRMADSIAATGKHLTAIFITHPDEDHYLGAASIVERFPGTPVYMTAAAIREFKRSSPQFFAGAKRAAPNEAPDSLVTPVALSDTTMSVDGERVEIVPDQQGDVLAPTNSYVWIPSLATVIAGDIVFNRVHPWLAASDTASRRRWHESIASIAKLHPRLVIAAHKQSFDTPDTPDVLGAMDAYLTSFDAARAAATTADGLIAAMKTKYPDWSGAVLLMASARAQFRPRS